MNVTCNVTDVDKNLLKNNHNIMQIMVINDLIVELLNYNIYYLLFFKF